MSGAIPVASSYVRAILDLAASEQSERTRFTVHPPNPPPVMRAPGIPWNRSRHFDQKIKFLAPYFVVIAQAGVRLVHQMTEPVRVTRMECLRCGESSCS